ncbi:CAP domain-containing protein [Pseudoduganella aquatica]|uniref:CAP domain-containing protein n=1 Tax=Pseudoduganella aquatica TaxID=2660641 RepID=UPI001E3B2BD3|nr:CAP domain-containing protein [Pseudoduganella aquatica]
MKHPTASTAFLPAPLTAAIAAAALAAMLAACGGGGGGSNNSAATPATVTQPTEPGAPTLSGDTALDGYNWINYRRQQAGLPALTRNALIDASALGHSNYQRLNNTVSHTQTAGQPGFTGATLSDRLRSAGYRSGGLVGEVISAASDKSGFYHAEELIGAIYHRYLILEPIFRETGTGAATGSVYTYFTAEFGTGGSTSAGVGRGNLVVYPSANQTRVPVNFFSDTESPDPVPEQNEVGYPISVQGDNSATVNVLTFTVRPRGGADLPVRLMTRLSDRETPLAAAAIIPLSVLKAATVYDVSFTGTVDGVTANRSWSFTTK